MFNSGIQQQVFQRPKAELCFRPWWDFVEDCALSTMLAIGKTNVWKGSFTKNFSFFYHYNVLPFLRLYTHTVFDEKHTKNRLLL